MTLAPSPRSQKLCFVYCGDDRCNCEAGSLSKEVRNQNRFRESLKVDTDSDLEVGDKVLKHTGDYQIHGEVRSKFTMKNGSVRYVVEHQSIPEGSFLHIYSRKNLKRVDQ